MNNHKTRRVGALVLALALALSLAVPAWAAPGDSGEPYVVPLTADKTTAAVGETITLTAVIPTELAGKTLMPSWNYDKTDIFELDSQNGSNAKFIMKGLKAGEVTISVQYFEDGDATVVLAKSEDITVSWMEFEPSGVTLDPASLNMMIGDSKTLAATVLPENAADKTVAWSSSDENVATVNSTGAVTAVGEGSAIITATTVNNLKAECNVTVSSDSSAPAEPTSVTVAPASLSMVVGGSETLAATVLPADAIDKTVAWSSSDEKVATVNRTGAVTAVGEGRAVITARTVNGLEAECNVTVSKPTITGLSFGTTTTLYKDLDDSPWDLEVITTPTSAEFGAADGIKWSVQARENSSPPTLIKHLPTIPEDANGRTVRITNKGPGNFTVIAEYMKGGNPTGITAELNVTVSGILLNTEEKDNKIKMLVGGTTALSVEKTFGEASGGSVADVVWTSTDPSTVSVIDGELIAWKLGTAIITANKNGYTATCEVEVVEDEDAVTHGDYTASTGNPLILIETAGELDTISIAKSATTIVDDRPVGGAPLSYITNLSVPTSQGTLYYNYNSQANTGEGVGTTARFARQAGASILSLDKLYFVPRQGFTGTAEITFNGWAQNGASFSGTIRVQVTGTNRLSYRTHTGEPVFFISDDFNTYCRGVTGRDLNYVTFNLPQSTQGTLYYNYASASRPGDRVSGSTQYSRAGRYAIEDVCFMPNAAFVGTAITTFRGVDTAGQAFTGEIEVVVSDSSEGETANVYLSTQRGQPATLQANLFNDACQATIRDTLSYVTFQLPAYNEGTLYYNYQSAGSPGTRVAAGTRYSYSGVPGINGVTFVPASSSTGRVAIAYTGYGIGGASFSGVVYINIGDTERATVRYFVAKNGVVSFDANDFNGSALLQMGVSMEYVRFHLPESLTLGELYYDYQGDRYYNNGVYSNFEYYRNPQLSNQGRLGLITFHAGASAGTVTIPYTAYSAADAAGNRETYTGSVVIQIGSPTPEEIRVSINKSGQLWLSSYSLANVCAPVMDKGLAYIEITGLPPEGAGRLYGSYRGFNTGTEVKRGDRFYCLGAPSIDQVSFIPYGGFTGEVEITYIGFSSDGQEQVSGRVVVTVTDCAGSQYFNDMANHRWAADAVDYLYRNGTVRGIGDGRFNPTGGLSKGDFTLMLVQAFGFTADRTVTFQDVPADSYYAKAISIASQLGIAGGSGGYFYPTEILSRQDAMLMIYNALLADGRSLTNGLAADLSGYRDEAQIASYAREAVGCMVQMGIVQGDGGGYLNPRSQLNRAEAAVLLHAVMTL